MQRKKPPLSPAKDLFRDGPWLPHEKEKLVERIDRMLRFNGVISKEKNPRAFQVLLDIKSYMEEVGMRNASVYLASPATPNIIEGSAGELALMAFSVGAIAVVPIFPLFALVGPLVCKVAVLKANQRFLFFDARIPETPEDLCLKKAIFVFLKYFGCSVNPEKTTTRDVNVCLSELYYRPSQPINRMMHTQSVLKALFTSRDMANLIFEYYGDGHDLEVTTSLPTLALDNTPSCSVSKTSAKQEVKQENEAKKSVTSLGFFDVNASLRVNLESIFLRLLEHIKKFDGKKNFNFDLFSIADEIRTWLQAAMKFLQPHNEKLRNAGITGLLAVLMMEYQDSQDLTSTAQRLPHNAVEQMRRILKVVDEKADCSDVLKAQTSQLIHWFDMVVEPKKTGYEKNLLKKPS